MAHDEIRRCFQRPFVGKHQVAVRFISFFFNYSEGCNAKNIIYFDQLRVKLKILAISFLPSAVVLERESSESWWISTLFLACEIDGGAWNGFLRFSQKRTDLSKKKIHSVCVLTKFYQSAKEERFWFFEPCHKSAILVDFCMDSLLTRSLLTATLDYLNAWNRLGSCMEGA